VTSGEAKEPGSVARRAGAVLAIATLGAACAIAACSRHPGPDDPVNELPFGALDFPVQGAQVKAVTPVAGWALDDRGVREIRLYVDGHIVNTGALTQERPDVRNMFPQYARGSARLGFLMLAGFDAPGPHTIIVQAVDDNGATREIGVVNVVAIDK